MDQGSIRKRSAVHNFALAVAKFCVHMPQNLVTEGAKLLTEEWFLVEPWSMDQADPFW